MLHPGRERENRRKIESHFDGDREKEIEETHTQTQKHTRKHMHVNLGTEEEERGERCSIRRAARDQLVTNNLLILLDGGDMNQGSMRVLLLLEWSSVLFFSFDSSLLATSSTLSIERIERKVIHSGQGPSVIPSLLETPEEAPNGSFD
jgi:hypothetical protein